MSRTIHIKLELDSIDIELIRKENRLAEDMTDDEILSVINNLKMELENNLAGILDTLEYFDD